MWTRITSSILFFLFLFLPIQAWPACTGGVCTVANCTSANVATAMNTAVSGDTVFCNVDGTYAWSGQVTIKAGVTLKGNGIGHTHITGNGALLTSNSRLTGFDFALGIGLEVTQDGPQGWRIDHNHIQDGSGGQPVWIWVKTNCASYPHPGGLIDNNTINDTRIVIKPCDVTSYSDHYWYERFRYWNDHSSGEKIYIEDNTITSTAVLGWVDGANSGRYVARFNNVTGPNLEAHGARLEDEWSRRGVQSTEIYGNVIVKNPGYWDVADFRIGSGVIFKNTVTGNGNLNWDFGTERCDSDYSGYWSGWGGQCNGSSSYDTTPNPASGTGYLCRDTFAGKDVSSGPNNSGPPPAQESLPAYFWGNTGNGSAWSADWFAGCEDAFVRGRDYYVDGSSAESYSIATGPAGGVGTGTTLPGTCTPYEGYWKTNEGSWNQSTAGMNGYGFGQGILYKCTSTNTWTAYYTPYTYPHPLRGEGGAHAISGTTVWGQSTGVTESNIRTFTGNGSGTCTASGSGNTEILTCLPGQYWIFEVVETDSVVVNLRKDKYRTGSGSSVLNWRTGAVPTPDGTWTGWTAYTVPFTSQKYTQVEVVAQ